MEVKINIAQKNYKNALKELSKSKDKYFDKALDVIINNNLFAEALFLYINTLYDIFDSKICNTKFNTKTDYLTDKLNVLNNARIYYISGKNYEKTIKIYLKQGKCKCIFKFNIIYR